MNKLDHLRSLLKYDDATGIFTWRVSRKGAGGMRRPGDRAGYVATRGYRKICVDGIEYREHSLAWLFTHGNWPRHGIDHINGVTDDNRIANLREATQSQNNANALLRANNSSGTRGVYRKRDKWTARIQFQGNVKHLGSFRTKEEAILARSSAAQSIFGEFSTASSRGSR